MNCNSSPMNLDTAQSTIAPVQSNCQPKNNNLDNPNYTTGNNGAQGYTIPSQGIPSTYNPNQLNPSQYNPSQSDMPTAYGYPITLPAPTSQNGQSTQSSDCQQNNNFFSSQFWQNYFFEQYTYYNFKLPPFQWYLERLFKKIANNFRLNAQGFQVIVNAGLSGYDGFVNMIITMAYADPAEASLLIKQTAPSDSPQTNYAAPNPYPDPSLPSSPAPYNPYIPPSDYPPINYQPPVIKPPTNVPISGSGCHGCGPPGGGGEPIFGGFHPFG